MRALMIFIGASALAATSAHAGPDHGKGGGKAGDKPAHDQSSANRHVEHSKDNAGGKGRDAAASSVTRGHGKPDLDGHNVLRHGKGHGDDFREVGYGHLVEGCPPGLAKKFNGCTPPGQAKKRDYFYDRSDWWGKMLPGGGRFDYRDGYLLRLGPDGRIGGFTPLLGGALAVGNAWPEFYQSTPLAPHFVDYFKLGPANSYRYADGVAYRMDPETSAITSIAALLTGQELRVGAPMPAGFDIYNVPSAYRDRYPDSPDAHYRYSDGNVYQVDPVTNLIASVISLAT